MLILTRKIDQSIIIQGNITVMILGVERDRVKLGIAAPEDVTVLREELVDQARGSAPQPIRPRIAGTASGHGAATAGNLALKPQPKRS
jgi:carbon storage regulator